MALLVLWIGTYHMGIHFSKPSNDEKACTRVRSAELQNRFFGSKVACDGGILLGLDRISQNEYDVLERSKGIRYGGILGVLKIALLALLVGARMRRAVRTSQIYDIGCDGAYALNT